MKTLITFILLISTTIGTQAMTGKEMLKNIRSNYNGLEALELQMQYELYKGFNSQELIESYTSDYKRKGNDSYRKIGNSEFINTDEFSLHVNHENRQIILSNPTYMEAINVDVKETLKWCKDVLVSEEGDENTLRLVMNKKTDLPYYNILVKMDKNFWISEITFYYAIQMDFSDSYFTKELDYPKMVVTYSKLKKRWKDKTGLLDTGRFFKLSADGITPTETYKDYQILDVRTQEKTAPAGN